MLLSYTDGELTTLARIMRAEALNEGDLGMVMVGNVITNRALGNCLTFKNVRSIEEVVFQANQFAGTNSPLFEAYPTKMERDLAKRVLKGEYYHPATHSLWFYAPKKNETCRPVWYNQNLSGSHKNHCFYDPEPGMCPEII